MLGDDGTRYGVGGQRQAQKEMGGRMLKRISAASVSAIPTAIRSILVRRLTGLAAIMASIPVKVGGDLRAMKNPRSANGCYVGS